MSNSYILPVMVEITADNPDEVIRQIAAEIHDHMDDFIENLYEEDEVFQIEMQYSIYTKGTKKCPKHGPKSCIQDATD